MSVAYLSAGISICLSVCTICICFVFVPALWKITESVTKEVEFDYKEFNALADNTWQEIMAAKRQSPVRAKRVPYNSCGCNVRNNCPQGKKGPVGEPGDDGDAGEPGDNGLIGLPGNYPPVPLSADGKCFMCPFGAKGADGPRGPPGPRGLPGHFGPPGKAGPQGDHGGIGKPGQSGNVGPKGDPGQDGLRGKKGETGKKGEAGAPGVAGEQGPKGQPGRNGQDGAQGGRGEPGPVGKDGVKGKTGKHGIGGKYCAPVCPKYGANATRSG